MKRLLPLVAVLLLLLLPSCMYWDIGGNIRSLAERHIGVDPTRQYRCGDEVVVPECCYHKSSWVACVFFPHSYGVEYYTYGEEFTGRYRVFERQNRFNNYGNMDSSPYPVGELRDVEGKTLVPINANTGEPLPGGATHEAGEPRIPCPISWNALRDANGEAVVERSSWYPVAEALAAPFDYAVDPVLMVVTAPFAWVYVAVDIIGALY